MEMYRKSLKLSLFIVCVLAFAVVFSLNLVSTSANCWQYEETQGGSKTSCNNAGCLWTINDSTDSASDVYDMWCSWNPGQHCCIENGCWRWDQDSTRCDNSTDFGLNCSYDEYSTMTLPNGTVLTGACFSDFFGGETGNMTWTGVTDGCWSNDGDKDSCVGGSNAQSCEWKPNGLNENPWCWIKSLSDAQSMYSDAENKDIGCCDMKGCWSYDGNETQCGKNTAFAGLCEFSNSSDDPWCPDDVGCCMSKWCTHPDVADNETRCTSLKQDLYMPCSWSGTACESEASGGFMFYNDTDSCLSTGGWWNSTDGCEMPTDTVGGGGGFMFVEDAHCWFADFQPSVCLNITGCIYCNDTGNYGNDTLSNSTSFDNLVRRSGTGNYSSACYGHSVGLCQGHEDVFTNTVGGTTFTVVDIALDSLNCTHIQSKGACQYGPLPNCKWTNSSALSGAFCDVGASSAQKSPPPVGFCDHPDSKNNYTMCKDLATKYFMPCKWSNVTWDEPAIYNVSNCTFNSESVFGVGTVAKEFEIISSDMLCVAAGGTWETSYYLDGEDLKQDGWCEKGALYDYATSTAAANKGNCDTDCWACEFNTTGGAWADSSGVLQHGDAQFYCENSSLGYCRYRNDSNAPNGMGWCDYPKEMDYGAGDCETTCKDCTLIGKYDDANGWAPCLGSGAGCKWVNNTNSDGTKNKTGECVSNTKKTCEDDCFSCYDYLACNFSSSDCEWSGTNLICKPVGFGSGEICYDGFDNDGDGMFDCNDPDCGFDASCGGSSIAGCAQYTTNDTCKNGVAFGRDNCTWINFSWEDVGHCGMPGEDCWLYDYNLTTCGNKTGCSNSSTGFDGFCDFNMTRESNSDCSQYTTRDDCNNLDTLGPSGNQIYNATTNCTWVAPEWGESRCEYWLWNECNGDNYRGNSTAEAACNANGNCSWNPEMSFCEITCFNMSYGQTECDTEGGTTSGVCEWKSGSSMCVPSHTQTMGSGGNGSMSGCNQHNGNYTGCTLYNFTCTWHNDSNADNNLKNEPDGWCDSKGDYDMIGTMSGEVTVLGYDGAETAVADVADIEDFGMRITDNAYGFGTTVTNITSAALCNGYKLAQGGTGNLLNKTEFYWYLDTDGDTTGNCNAIGYGGGTTAGFEFYISYVTRNTSAGMDTKKNLYRCMLNASSEYQWVITNVFVTDNKKFSCFLSNFASGASGTGFVTVEKESLENFDEFNISTPMRVLASTATSDSSRSDPEDSVGPDYYTPGTFDFDFVDCSDPDTKDTKCKNFKKFGFNMFEDCKNGVDDDSDGYADCSDPKCSHTPTCSTDAYSFEINTSDHETPTVTYSNVDKMSDAAFITFDTDEPANGTLYFYNASTDCSPNALNSTVYDLGSGAFTYDDYKPNHKITLDSSTLDHDLAASTNYFYKVEVCDYSENCGMSKCLNFTTKKANKNFIFSMDIPEGFNVTIPALEYSGNFTTAVGTKVYDIGIKTNSSETKHINVTVNKDDLSLTLVGVDLYKPKKLDLEKAFYADTENEVVGVNASTKSWQMIVDDMGLGGANDYVEMEFPVAYDEDNRLNWTDDVEANWTDVTDYTTCRSIDNDNATACAVPISIGFSRYTITAAAADSTSTSTSTSSSGSSGEAISISWTTIDTYNEAALELGVNRELAASERVKLELDEGDNHIGVSALTETTATIRLIETGTDKTISATETAKFDVDGDGYYDVGAALNGISDSKAQLTFQTIHEKVPLEETPGGQAAAEVADYVSKNWWWLVIVIVVIIAGVVARMKWVEKQKLNPKKHILVKKGAFEKVFKKKPKKTDKTKKKKK